MIELKNHQLVFRFPEVHPDAKCSIGFQRTLRIPDDDRDYPLPPGLGPFPLDHVDDYAGRLTASWRRHGGVLLPMYQAEAMWLNFEGGYPMAVKVAAGKIDAVTGKKWSNKLSRKRQNYLVLPDQPWLDGFCVEEGLIRQFVAMPLGEGFTAEEQLTGEAEHGGLQVAVTPMRATEYERLLRRRRSEAGVYCGTAPPGYASAPPPAMCPREMGLAPGGRMRQELYEDTYGFDHWDRSVRSRCFVHILNSEQYLQVCGAAPPTRPPTAQDYTNAGLPWFEHYDGDRAALRGARRLARLKSVAEKLKEGKKPLPDNDPVEPAVVHTVGGDAVREGDF